MYSCPREALQHLGSHLSSNGPGNETGKSVIPSLLEKITLPPTQLLTGVT